ncbi:unnamed protein product, partial [marine sediment metagenome]
KGDIILEVEYRIHKKYNEKLKAEPVYNINKVKIFSHKMGDVISEEEDQNLQKIFGKIFYQKESLLSIEEEEESEIEEEIEEPKEGIKEEEKEVEEVKEKEVENKEIQYRITKVDGLISETNLKRLEEEKNLSLRANFRSTFRLGS